MKPETLEWAVKQWVGMADHWAKDAAPVYAALGMGLGFTMVDGECVEEAVPTERELRDWFIKAAKGMAGPTIQKVAKEPRYQTRISVRRHGVLFQIVEEAEHLNCYVCIELNAVSCSARIEKKA